MQAGERDEGYSRRSVGGAGLGGFGVVLQALRSALVTNAHHRGTMKDARRGEQGRYSCGRTAGASVGLSWDARQREYAEVRRVVICRATVQAHRTRQGHIHSCNGVDVRRTVQVINTKQAERRELSEPQSKGAYRLEGKRDDASHTNGRRTVSLEKKKLGSQGREFERPGVCHAKRQRVRERW